MTRPQLTCNDLEVLEKQAQIFLESRLLPSGVRDFQKVMVVMLLGRELNISPWQAINSIHIIDGTPTMAPQLMLALIRTSGHLKNIVVDSNDKKCSVTMHRVGNDPHTEVFTMVHANRLKLSAHENYQTQPAVMLKWRAIYNVDRINGLPWRDI